MIIKFIDLKKYNKVKIIEILTNKLLNLMEKQLKLEKFLVFNLNKLYDDNFIYKKQFLIFRNKLLNINWLDIPGKTFLKEFFKVISIVSFIDLILMHTLMPLKHYNCYSSNVIKNYLINNFKTYAYYNKIDIIHIKKDSLKVCINSEVLEKSLAYIVEYLKDIKVIKFDAILCKGDDINYFKNQILLSYRFVYDYYLNYKDFEAIRINPKKYELNSLNIFKIK